MREIKFRGKNIETGEWIYGYYVYTHDRHRIIYEDYEGFYCEEEVIPETVGQYTGLKDKNGTEIYEGDIVVVHEGEDFKWTHHVEFFRGGFWVTDENCLGAINDFCEVVGNIYDDKHLLEGET